MWQIILHWQLPYLKATCLKKYLVTWIWILYTEYIHMYVDMCIYIFPPRCQFSGITACLFLVQFVKAEFPIVLWKWKLIWYFLCKSLLRCLWRCSIWRALFTWKALHFSFKYVCCALGALSTESLQNEMIIEIPGCNLVFWVTKNKTAGWIWI